MWTWFLRLLRRIDRRWDDYRQRRIDRWLKANPDRIRIDEKRLKEWARRRDA